MKEIPAVGSAGIFCIHYIVVKFLEILFPAVFFQLTFPDDENSPA